MLFRSLLCNSGCLPADEGFLAFLRETATREGALLIFDEVITGFRLALGGAQEFYGVTPDLATYAKAAAGGLPLSILAGRRKYMNWIADGRVVHAGTLNGNPLALAAAREHPDRFAVMGRIAPQVLSKSKGALIGWRKQPGMLGLRLAMNVAKAPEILGSGKLDWLWAEAEAEGVALMMLMVTVIYNDLTRITWIERLMPWR